MIILEGPDKAGKTTLAQRIAEDLNGKYFHFGVPTKDGVHTNDLMKEVGRQPSNTVFDRGGLSAFAYDFKSMVDHKMTPIQQLDDALRFCNERNVRMWYVFASEETLAKRLAEEGDANDYINERELIYIKRIYDLLVERATQRNLIRIEMIDTTFLSIDDIMQRNGRHFQRALI